MAEPHAAVQEKPAEKSVPPQPEKQNSPNLVATPEPAPPSPPAESAQPTPPAPPVASAPPASTAPSAPTPAPVTPVKTEPAPDKLYELQAGAYRVEDNAKAAHAKIQQAGFNSRIVVSASNDGKTWYIVRSGKYESYDLAKQAGNSLEKKTGLETVVKKNKKP